MKHASSSCTTCRAAIPPDIPSGWCPYCLGREIFGAALQPDAPPGGEAAGKDAGGSFSFDPNTLSSQAFPYHKFELIGKGAFGVVYRAEQWLPVSRPVAIKFLRSGVDSADILRRFEQERQALARMEHPHIARLYDGGATPLGHPYFVMDLVEGLPLTAYCEGRRLDLAARLRLFITFCEAVQHAHQKGVLHRDLKPQHLLVATVDGSPVPKIIDFGLAKALQPEADGFANDMTAQHTLLGTPPYLSPEQASRTPDIDTRSDIYSLGVILYEVLTGQAPLSPQRLRQESGEEILRAIREEETPRPSASVLPRPGEEAAARKRAAELRGDLDWIILKALHKDRGQRYASAEALAEDLRRHLAHEPVSAGPPGIFYRLGKTLRRHRALASSLAAAAVLTVAFFTWHGWVQRDTNRKLRAALEEALALRSFLLFDLRHEFDRTGREDVLEVAAGQASAFSSQGPLSSWPQRPEFDPRRFQALTHHLHGQAAAFRDNLAAARQAFESEAALNRSLWASHPGHLSLALDLVAGHSNLAGLLLRLEEPAAARALLAELDPALASLENTAAIPRAQVAGHRLIVLTALTRARRESGDKEAARAALAHARTAAEAYREAAGPSATVRLILEPESEEARLALAEGRPDLALACLDRVRASLLSAVAASLEDWPLHGALALCHRDRLLACLQQQKLGQAREEFTAAFDLLQNMRHHGYSESSLWRERLIMRAGHDLGEAFLAAGDVPQADEILRFSSRIIQLNQARPTGVVAPSADLARHNWLTGRRRAAQPQPGWDGVFLSYNRAVLLTRQAIQEAPHDLRWKLDLAERAVALAEVLERSPELAGTVPLFRDSPGKLRNEAAAALQKVLAHPSLTPDQRARALKLQTSVQLAEQAKN